MEIFQALHGEVQHSSELLSIALDDFSGSKRHATGMCILLALAETIVRTDTAQLSSFVERDFLRLFMGMQEKLGRRR